MSQFGPSRAGDILARYTRALAKTALVFIVGAGLGVGLAKLLRWVVP